MLHETAVQGYLDQLVAASHVPGMCVGIRTPGMCQVFRSGRANIEDDGLMPVDTRFELGCIGKSLIALVVLELAREGHLSIDAPVSEYVRELQGSERTKRISLGHLASHTAGYAGVRKAADASPEFGRAELFEHVREARQLFVPGTVFNYEDVSALLLEVVIERVTGVQADQVIDERILAPLGISGRTVASGTPAIPHSLSKDRSGFIRDRSTSGSRSILNPRISGRAYTVGELLDLGQMCLTGRSSGSGTSVMPETTIALLREPRIRLPDFLGRDDRYQLPVAYGSGIASFGPGIYGSDGMGVGQALSLRFCTGKNVVVAVGVNASGSRIRMLLMYALLRELGCLSDSPRSKRSALLDWGNPATLAGRYQGADGTELVARVSGARLDLLIVGQDSAHIARVTGSFDADGFLTLDSTHSLSGIAIFKDPDTDGPCVQVGLYAYRRISA